MSTQLAFALENAGFQIKQVYSRSVESAEKFANDLYTDFTTNIRDIILDADLYIISVTDDAVELLANELNFNDKLVVHTSGSLPMEVLKKTSTNFGVFYPLQTFSKTRKADFKSIPICIEANISENENLLLNLANTISKDVSKIKFGRTKNPSSCCCFCL